MKNIYMFQVNYMYGNTVHLPYTAGVLLAYAFSDKQIQKEYKSKKIFFIRENPDIILEQITNPSVIGFSSYIWNFEYNKYIAAKIKENYPDCTIIFGGHHVEPGERLLIDCPYIDYLIHGEGEESFCRLLKYLIHKDDIFLIPGISYRTDNGLITNKSYINNDEWIDIPSPYINGFFDSIMTENPNKRFMALIETTRGCPNSCSYCDWSNMKSRIRKFPINHIYEEIKWVSEHRIFGLGSADSNFGVFERDEDIVSYLVEMHKKTGYPKGYQTSYAKNSNERIFRIGCVLEKYRLSKGVTLSFQSMDKTVLENIGRKNISVDTYRELMEMYNSAGIATYTELILGLPGENFNTFTDGIDLLLKMGQHHTLYIHNCECLPCSIMSTPEYIKKYKINTSRILLNQPHIENKVDDGINEFSSLVTSTYSMSSDDWVQMNLFSFTVQCFHHMGLLQFFALYLHNEKNVSYRMFYKDIMDWLLTSDNVSSKTLLTIKCKLQDIVDGKENARFTICDSRFGGVQWPFEEYLFLCTVYHLHDFYTDFKKIINHFSIESDLSNQLLEFQELMIKRPYQNNALHTFDYNFSEYFLNALKGKTVDLKKENVTIEIKAMYYKNWQDYSKKVAWYGRKDNRCIYLDDAAERNEDD